MKRPQLTVVHSHRATTRVFQSERESFDGSLWEENYYSEYEKSFAREVEAYRRLGHLQGSTIPRLYGLGRVVSGHGEGRAISPKVLFMEYIPGKKEHHMRSKEVRNAAATRSTESPGVGVDGSWANEAMGGAFRTLRPLPIDEFESELRELPQMQMTFLLVQRVSCLTT
ncbi:hypothetical protein EV702DRAFT_645537 [Suillus placidus]|uniref:Uncharacterized protein n=1 Tax=Suillus placidus TaxID=48579 RepID=A0A9P7A299_9AGAM|nr:hypothetical protein EV702DRAFT_645537 [Suillus placidus]